MEWRNNTMKGKDLLSISDLTPTDVQNLVIQSIEIKTGSYPRPLEGKVIALLFEKPSLRTRVSFEVGIRKLGGDCFYLGGSEIGLGTREPVKDVARVLDRWVDGIIARVFSHENLMTLANNTSVPVINALSDVEHPCQAMADLLTIYEHKSTFNNQKLAYIGDGNNVANSLALACASVGIEFVIAVPEGYQIESSIWTEVELRSQLEDSENRQIRLPEKAVFGADVVYTDVWVSMGQDDESSKRIKAFEKYQVSPDLLGLAKPDAIFMHDMPAHEGQEITVGMLDHPQSVVFDQAENRLHAQAAIMMGLFAD